MVARTLSLFFALSLAPPVVAGAASDALREGLSAYTVGSYEIAWKRLEPLANAGNAEAHWRLALMCVKAQGRIQDYRCAMEHFTSAANAGHVRSFYDVGLMHELGEGRSVDHRKADQWYERGIELGCAACARQLGLRQIDKNEVIDEETAARWLRQAVDLGDAPARVSLARLRLAQDGRGAVDEAFRLLDSAVDEGNAQALLIRSQLLWSVPRAPTDAPLAIRDLRRLMDPELSADLSSGERLAVSLTLMRGAVLGWGMRQNWSEALTWAGQVDVLLRELGGEEWEIYPTHAHLKSLMDALSELRRDGEQLGCSAARTIRLAGDSGLLPMTDVTAFFEAMRDVELEPQNTEGRCRLHIRELTVSYDASCGAAPICAAPHLRSDAVLPSFENSSIAFDLKTPFQDGLIPQR